MKRDMEIEEERIKNDFARQCLDKDKLRKI
jgi:hypothetical protein